MPLHPALHSLADRAQQAAHERRLDRERQQARYAWVRRIIADHEAAQARANEAWARLLAEHPEEDDDDEDDDDEALDDNIHPPEQDEADAILAQIAAARDQDRWPRELYWSL